MSDDLLIYALVSMGSAIITGLGISIILKSQDIFFYSFCYGMAYLFVLTLLQAYLDYRKRKRDELVEMILDRWERRKKGE